MDPADAGLQPQLLHGLVSDGQAAAGGVIVRHDGRIKHSRIKKFRRPETETGSAHG